MKTIYLFTFISFFFILLGCNSPNSKKDISKEKDSTTNLKFAFLEKYDGILKNFCEEAGSGSFLIKRSLGDSLTKHFKELYSKNANGSINPSIVDSFWLSSCAISEMKNFFDTAAEYNYDGARIIFAALPQPGNPMTIYIVPTYVSKNYTGAKGRSHTDKWDKMLINCPGSSTYFSSHKDAQKNIETFGSLYLQKQVTNGPALRDSFSEKIWIDKCVIKSIAQILELNPSVLDGINIKLGAYYEKDTLLHPGQFRRNQSTIILVTSGSINNGPKTDIWEVNEILFVRALWIKANPSAFNHSQLCPQICN